MFLERCKKLPIHISWQHIAIPKVSIFEDFFLIFFPKASEYFSSQNFCDTFLYEGPSQSRFFNAI
ncbi:unnamed protein product [Meloidogyne enterolobii]|uniref:Uncharacterized protein n=1 Tax=Meloidogyne enterolobii TaxID=390850 RepID=A0ACB0Z0A4_MELEN